MSSTPTRNFLARLGASTSTAIVFLLLGAESKSRHFSVGNSSSRVLFSLDDSDNTFHLLSIGSENAFLLFSTGISSSIDGSGILFLFFLASSGVIFLFCLCSLGRILCLGRGGLDVVPEALGSLPGFRSEGFQIIGESVEISAQVVSHFIRTMKAASEIGGAPRGVCGFGVEAHVLCFIPVV